MAGADAYLSTRLTANEGQIGLKGFAFAADRRADAVIRGLHDLANAMGQEPCGLHAAIEGPLYLPCRNAFLARHDELDRLQPKMEGKVAVFEDAAYAHRKSFAAGVALAETWAAGLSGQPTDAFFVAISAVRAGRTLRPEIRFNIGESGLFVMEMGGGY